MTKPLVSLLTPTFNRRPYFKTLFKCILAQDYPLDRIEWVIGDDGTDKINDLVDTFKAQGGIKNINYISYEEKLKLGDKRTRIAKAAQGDILIHIDDDDYYPPQRVSHAVDVLLTSGKLVAYTPVIHIYFKHNKELRNVGPFPLYCAPEASFAYRREVLIAAAFSNTDSVAEGIGFLKMCQDSFAELTPRSTIVCFSHNGSSVPKSAFTEKNADGKGKYSNVKETALEMTDLVRDPEILTDYLLNIDREVHDYAYTDPALKADIAALIDESAAAKTKLKAFQESPGVNLPLKNGKQLLLDRKGIARLVAEAQKYSQDLKSSKSAHIKTLNELFEAKYGRKDREPVTPRKIAFIVAGTQKSASENLWKQNFLENFFGSLVDGLSPDHQFVIYLVVDKGSPYGNDTAAHDLLKMIAAAHINKLGLSVELELLIKPAACQMECWKAGYEASMKHNPDLFYFAHDDCRFLSKGWDNEFVALFRDPNKLKLAYMMCDEGRNCESFMIGKKHREHFPNLFPDEVTDLECEEWIFNLYHPDNSMSVDHHVWKSGSNDRRIVSVKERLGAEDITTEVNEELTKLAEEAKKKAQLSKPVVAKWNSNSTVKGPQ
tara:strand:+ start:322 stop:2133 length:1812 start_codon:yes stop_codon:yes gene_type:complete